MILQTPIFGLSTMTFGGISAKRVCVNPQNHDHTVTTHVLLFYAGMYPPLSVLHSRNSATLVYCFLIVVLVDVISLNAH